VRRALTDALALARLQADVLIRLEEAARAAVERAAARIEGALVTFDRRGKTAREEAIASLREVETDLTALGQRLRKTS
jgi:hypothetical protein